MNEAIQKFTTPVNTPWGEAQHIDYLPSGVLFVSTASHGGYLVPKDVVFDRFELKYISCANDYCDESDIPDGYLAFEEDCAGIAVLINLPETRVGLQNFDLDKAKETWEMYYGDK